MPLSQGEGSDMLQETIASTITAPTKTPAKHFPPSLGERHGGEAGGGRVLEYDELYIIMCRVLPYFYISNVEHKKIDNENNENDSPYACFDLSVC